MESPNISITPPHVPAHLLRDIDIFALQPVDGDIHLAWHQLHEGPDIFYTTRNGGHWIFTRAEQIQDAYRNHEQFSSRIVAVPYVDTGFRFAPAEYDPPELNAYRSALAPAFSPKAMANYEVIIRTLCVELIEGIRGRRECDFQSAISQRLPIRVFLRMMDFPLDDADYLLPLVEDQTRNPDPAAVQASMNAMIAYLSAKVEERRRLPGSDLTSKVIGSLINGQIASQQEVLSMCINLMFAGLDTVVAALGFAMRYLATHPTHQRELAANSDLIPDAVEELLRYHGITNLARMVRSDMTYEGVEMRQGEPVVLSTTLFGLDERRFSDPTNIDFRRADKTHMIFGSGPHRCLGSHLARLELRIFFREWFARIPQFSLKPDATVIARSGRNNSMVALPLVW